MVWFSRSPRTEDGPGAAVDLRTLAGLSGKLLFAHGLRAHHMVQITCNVLKVDRSAILVEPTGGNARPGPDSAVILEVLHQSALIQCFTTVGRVDKAGGIYLRVPARPHVVQRRRNPRVDIYLGVTIHTPDRPIEETAAQMINLSLDGAACVLTEPLTPGTEITVNLAPLGVPAQVRAEVVRCMPTPTHLWVVGIRFDRLSREYEQYLTRYINDFTLSVQGAGESLDS